MIFAYLCIVGVRTGNKKNEFDKNEFEIEFDKKTQNSLIPPASLPIHVYRGSPSPFPCTVSRFMKKIDPRR